MDMTTFATISTILSLALFGGFVLLGFRRFGILSSYSSYARKWTEAVPINNHTHLWSIVTIVTALLLVPAMIEAGDESPLQFLGFAAPVYLGVVGFTPEYETKHKQMVVHFIGTVICSAAAVLWLVIALREWYQIPIALAVFGVIGFLTQTLRKSYVLWLELSMFAAVYAAVLI